MVFHTKRRQEDQTPDKIKRSNNFKVTSEFFEKNDEIAPKIINEEQIEYFEKASEIAKLSNCNHKHGAILVYKNKIISYGYNYLTPYLKASLSTHAETDCILNIKKTNRDILQYCDLYVVRLSPIEGINKYSKPCEKCSNFINKYNIRKIYYSTNYRYDQSIFI